MTDPTWLDRGEYPFAPHTFTTDAGRMHYLDVGDGPPLVMVHGTPTWSFLYRHLVKDLSRDHRCIVPDHLGFGLSDKPTGWGYRPADHARNLAALIDHLGLRNITLVVHDFGGPIGLSYALQHPENVQRLVLFNTWMWSRRNEPQIAQASKLLGGPVGKLLYTRCNFSPRVMLRLLWGDKTTFTKQIHQHYIRPLPNAQARMGTWVLARELLASSDWYEALWQQRERIVAKPALLLWGMQDAGFGQPELERWQQLFTNAKTVTFANTGHLVQEEQGTAVVPLVQSFLAAA